MNIRRRTFSKEFKLHVLREVQSGKTAAEVARQYQVHPNLLVKWRNQVVDSHAGCFGKLQRVTRSLG